MQQSNIYEVTLKNFKSFGNNLTSIKLDTNDLTLIIGRNLDVSVNGQIDSNGSGKTSLLLDAICFTLFDKTITGVSKDKLINKINKKNMEVSVAFKKGDDYYRIIRYRKNKNRGGNGVSIFKGSTREEVSYENVMSEKDIAQAGNADKQILELFGIPYEMFTRIVLFSATNEPFLSLPTTSSTNKPNQKFILEELIGVSEELYDKANKLNKDINKDKNELDKLNTVENELNNQKNKIINQIQTLKTESENWESDKINQINNLNIQIDKLSKIDYDNQKYYISEYNRLSDGIKVFEQNKKVIIPNIINLKDKINNIKSWDNNHKQNVENITLKYNSYENIDYVQQHKLLELYDEYNNEIKLNNSLKQTTIMKLNNIIKVKDNIDKEIEHLSTNKCPYCLQKYEDASLKIDELELNLVDILSDINKHQSTLDELVLKNNNLDNKIKQIEVDLKFKQLHELHTHKNNKQILTDEYNRIINETNPYSNESLDDLLSELYKLENKRDSLSEAINIVSNDLDDIKNKLLYISEVELDRDIQKLSNLKIELTKISDSINPYTKSINEFNNINFDKSNIDKIKELDRKISHKVILHKFLTRPDSFIRKAILSERLEYLNDRLRYYLDILGLPHKVIFNEELDVIISQFNNEITYEELSAGQKARINISLSFAFRDMLQKRFGKINLCVLDECLDVGLSTAGVTQAVKMIKKVAKDNKLSMFVISHRDEIVSSFDKILEVELSNGFSTVVE